MNISSSEIQKLIKIESDINHVERAEQRRYQLLLSRDY